MGWNKENKNKKSSWMLKELPSYHVNKKKKKIKQLKKKKKKNLQN